MIHGPEKKLKGGEHKRKSVSLKIAFRVVPRAGVEPARPFGQRILSPVMPVLPDLTNGYEPVFTRLAVVKVLLRLASYQYVLSPS